MSFAPVINLHQLLQPISAECPAGTDLRTDRSPGSAYYSLKDARNSARATERSSLFDDGVDLLKSWRIVSELAPEILASRSKDLEVACWFTEALTRLHGIAGLRDGICLIHGLARNFWTDLYPLPDEDGIETRLAPLTGLNGDGGEGTLMTPIRNMPITISGSRGAFNLWQYQKARDNAKLSDDDERSARIEALGFSLQDIEGTVYETTPEFYAQMIATLEETLANYRGLHSLVRELCGAESPPSSNISGLLDEVLRTVRFLSKDQLALHDTQNADTELTGNPAHVAQQPDAPDRDRPEPHTACGPVTHREEALRRLQEIGDYFRLHEPHTPLAPGIERLVRWGRMTVAELMMELLPADSSRGFYSQLTGLKLDGSDAHRYVAPAASIAATAPAQPAPPVADAVTATTTESAAAKTGHSW